MHLAMWPTQAYSLFWFCSSPIPQVLKYFKINWYPFIHLDGEGHWVQSPKEHNTMILAWA